MKTLSALALLFTTFSFHAASALAQTQWTGHWMNHTTMVDDYDLIYEKCSLLLSITAEIPGGQFKSLDVSEMKVTCNYINDFSAELPPVVLGLGANHTLTLPAVVAGQPDRVVGTITGNANDGLLDFGYVLPNQDIVTIQAHLKNGKMAVSWHYVRPSGVSFELLTGSVPLARMPQ
jgi:hypothetical protein